MAHLELELFLYFLYNNTIAETVTVRVMDTVTDTVTTGLSSGVSPDKLSATSPPGGLLGEYGGNV